MNHDEYFMDEAYKEAKKSLTEGGIPIGAILVKNNEIISRGHNKLIQENSVILHAEMDAIENAGRLEYDDYINCILYTTLSPCSMCSGAIVLYNIPKVVIGDNTTLMGAEEYLKNNGIKIKILNHLKSKKLFKKYLINHSKEWENELNKVGNSTK